MFSKNYGHRVGHRALIVATIELSDNNRHGTHGVFTKVIRIPIKMQRYNQDVKVVVHIIKTMISNVTLDFQFIKDLFQFILQF